MTQTPSHERAIDLAVARLLRPLFRVLLRHGRSYSAFEEVAKRTYVEVAMEDFGIPGKKPSVARASILSGLTRKEVQRLLQTAPSDDAASGEHHNRAARVLTAWVRDADFHDPQGLPRPLDVDGDFGFAALVKRHSGDMPVRAVLDELLRVGAVEQQADGRIALLARGYVPRRSAPEMVAMLGTDVADLIETIDHNLHQAAEPGQAPRFQRKVMYLDVPAHAVPAFRLLSAERAQTLLEQLDRWLHSACSREAPAGDPQSGARLGLGIYYFEETPARQGEHTGERT
jgi:hypothetical protein